MATTIKLKNGSGAPTTGDLVQGEPAFDLTNKRLYTEDSGGSVIEVGTNPSTLTVDTTTLVVDAGNNRVGIGTASPAVKTQIVGSGAIFRISDDVSTSGTIELSASSSEAVIHANTYASAVPLVFKNASTERMRITSAGNVGIGITPSYTLDIQATASSFNPVRFSGHSSSVDAFLYTDTAYWSIGDTAAYGGNLWGGNKTSNFVHAHTNGSERMRIDSSGNVGINQSAPDAQLTFNPPNYTSTATGGMIKWKNSNNSGHSNIQSYFVSGEGTDINIGANAYINTSGAWSRWSSGLATCAVSCGRSGNISFITNTSSGDGITRAIIDNSGNLGLGTTAPSSYGGGFVVDDLGINIVTASSSSPGTNKLSWWSDNNGISQNAYISTVNDGATTNTGEMVFYTKNSSATLAERMRISASGNLLVGTTSPVGGSSVAGVTITEVSNIGQISIGKTYSGSTAAVKFYFGTTQVGRIDYSDTATTYVTTSDQRLKENIVDAPAGNIDAIRVRSFDWKADGTHQPYGMIAQELVEVAPEAVSQGETEEDHWGVDYSKLVPMMIKEIQDLKAEVAALKGE